MSREILVTAITHGETERSIPQRTEDEQRYKRLSRWALMRVTDRFDRTISPSYFGFAISSPHPAARMTATTITGQRHPTPVLPLYAPMGKSFSARNARTLLARFRNRRSSAALAPLLMDARRTERDVLSFFAERAWRHMTRIVSGCGARHVLVVGHPMFLQAAFSLGAHLFYDPIDDIDLYPVQGFQVIVDVRWGIVSRIIGFVGATLPTSP